ncbi:hypothetical protein ACHAXA_010238 [Cyclostephanos tholiformis]|uniref:Secondary thiamine-phosphate synthase enzyme n=1 Tax=Cyclostephanos tholiformis TaxID=382380 RepID=A0ABD3SG66_9STRA
MHRGRNYYHKEGRQPPLLSILLLIVPATAFAFAFVPSARAAHQQAGGITTAASSSSSCDQGGNRRQNNNDDASSTSIMPETNAAPSSSSVPMLWFQHEMSITAPSRGCHLITSQVNRIIKDDVSRIRIGMANLFILHTSASLTINENADPDVCRDMEVAMNKIVPGTWTTDGTFRHTTEGEDDMPGHVKSSLMGVSLNIPIRNGRLALGTWQGIYLNEHRDQGGWGGGHTRGIIITLQGQS